MRPYFLAVLLCCCLSPAHAEGGALLSWNAPSKSRVGSTFSLRLTLEANETVNQLALRIGFDATSLEVLRVVGGSASTIDPKGQVALDTASPNGVSGTFATITFRAIDASPSSPVQVLSVRASNAGGRSIDVAVPGIAPMLINP